MKLNLLTESEFNDYISSGEYVYESELFYSVDFDSLYSLSYINAPVVDDFIYIMVIDEDLFNIQCTNKIQNLRKYKNIF